MNDLSIEYFDSLRIEDISSLSCWASLLFAGDSIFVKDSNVSLDFYGEGDDRYLVIEVAIQGGPFEESAEHIVDQFVLDPDSGSRPLAAIFRMLDKVDFSLKQLVTSLEELSYSDQGTHDEARLHGIPIKKQRISST